MWGYSPKTSADTASPPASNSIWKYTNYLKKFYLKLNHSIKDKLMVPDYSHTQSSILSKLYIYFPLKEFQGSRQIFCTVHLLWNSQHMSKNEWQHLLKPFFLKLYLIKPAKVISLSQNSLWILSVPLENPQHSQLVLYLASLF